MKINWGFSIIIVYVIFIAGMVLMAVKASEQTNDMVTENYYDEAVNYQNKIEASNNASNSESKLSINYVSSSNAVEVNIGKTNESNISGSLLFYKPDKASEDFKVDFTPGQSGTQIIPVKKLAHGYWKVDASWTMNGKAFFEEQKIFIP